MLSVKGNILRVAAATVASGVLAAGAVALASSASASTTSAHTGTSYRFQTLDNAHDLTFNQLLGINDEGVISGYFGSGAAGHPNKGYLLLPRERFYINENFPHSKQTQVTGLNNRGAGTTTINGVNDFGQLVGFYTTDGGNITNGFLASPRRH